VRWVLRDDAALYVTPSTVQERQQLELGGIIADQHRVCAVEVVRREQVGHRAPSVTSRR